MRAIVLLTTALTVLTSTVVADHVKRNELPTWGEIREAALDTLLEDL